MLNRLMGEAKPPPGTGEAAPVAGAEPAGTPGEAAGRLELPQLSSAARAAFDELLKTEPCACGKPHSLGVSVAEHPRCRNSVRLAESFAHLLAEGISLADARAKSAGMRKALENRNLGTSQRPSLGNPHAQVTVVVFADFQCPHCAAEAPKLRRVIQGREDARLVFKHFPLKSQSAAHRAAQATEAAFAQGGDKGFWAMHDRVFAAQRDLDGDVDAVLRGHAEAIGLDLPQYDTFMAENRGKGIVDADRRAGESAGIMGTPAIYVNGRALHPDILGGDLQRTMDDALRR
jgi:protein-disulfide isomerase